jgi:hypothetical protein
VPYIKPEHREELDRWLGNQPGPLVLGDLNYVLTKILNNWWVDGINYDSVVGVLGTLDAVGKEFYRRAVAPYEDRKREENGDVY